MEKEEAKESSDKNDDISSENARWNDVELKRAQKWLIFSQNCFGDKSSILNSPISTTIDHRGAHNISANSFSF